jgi:hypothetical protein
MISQNMDISSWDILFTESLYGLSSYINSLKECIKFVGLKICAGEMYKTY